MKVPNSHHTLHLELKLSSRSRKAHLQISKSLHVRTLLDLPTRGFCWTCKQGQRPRTGLILSSLQLEQLAANAQRAWARQGTRQSSAESNVIVAAIALNMTHFSVTRTSGTTWFFCFQNLSRMGTFKHPGRTGHGILRSLSAELKHTLQWLFCT